MKRRVTVKSENGVTITAMIVAVILLIILTAVSITAVRSSERDVFETAYDAKTGMEVSTYQEELDIIDVQCSSEQLSNGLSADDYISLFQTELAEDSTFENATVEKKTNSSLRIQTEEGYVFTVNPIDGVEYAGVDGEFTETYAITDDDVTFTYTPYGDYTKSGWANDYVKVEITLNFDMASSDDTFQFSFDKETWYDYTTENISLLNVESNCKIYVMYETYGDDYVVGEVTQIDKVAPIAFDDKVVTIEETTTQTITISGYTLDSDETDEYNSVKSGISHYEFAISEDLTQSDSSSLTWYDLDDSATYDSSSSDIIFTFDGLTQTTEYVVYIKAVDEAGNETIGYKTAETTTVPDANECLTLNFSDNYSEAPDEFSSTEMTWTNESVYFSIEVIDEEVQELIDEGTYVIQYTIDGTSWGSYEDYIALYGEEIEVSENATVGARLYDGKNSGEENLVEIECIDKVAPTTPEVEATDVGDDYITVTVTSTDTLGEIDYYYYLLQEHSLDEDDNDTRSDGIGTSTTATEMTFSSLEGDSYYITVVVYDKAGNVSEETEILIATGTNVPNLTYDYNKYGWGIGDYVEYPIDLDGDGDYTNDWRIFYIKYKEDEEETEESSEEDETSTASTTTSTSYSDYTDEDPSTIDYSELEYVERVYLISAEYIETGSSYIDLSELQVVESQVSSFGFTWGGQYTTSLDTDVYEKDDNGSMLFDDDGNIVYTDLFLETNEIFMNEWDFVTNYSRTNVKLMSILMDTNNWDGLVYSADTDEDEVDDWFPADYAIGSPTFEMWAASWLESGYTEIFYKTGSNGYGYETSIEDDDSAYGYYTIINFSVTEKSGYGDDLYFKSNANAYVFSSPTDISSTYYLMSVMSDGMISDNYSTGYVDNTSGEYVYEHAYLRPVIALSEDVIESIMYDETGIVVLDGTLIDNSDLAEDEIATAEIELSYTPTTWTNGNAKVSVTLDDTTIENKIKNGTYKLQYIIVGVGESLDEITDDMWETSTSTEMEIVVEENATVYIRIFDGTRSGDYASATINIIDKAAPTVTLSSATATLNSITLTVSGTDDEDPDDEYNSGTSGIDHYEFILTDTVTGEETTYETQYAVTSYVISDLVYDRTYTVQAIVYDKAGNASTNTATKSVTTISQASTGDWVYYPIDLNGDGDYTNDWRLFYVTDDATVEYDTTDTSRMTSLTTTDSGQAFLIAADYLDSSSKYLNYDTADTTSGTGLSKILGRSYVLYWKTAPSYNQIYYLLNDDETSELITTTNSLFMANFSNLATKSSGSVNSNNNAKTVSTLLNTSNWTSFVSSKYADYAIGSPTLEMWVKAWNSKGYTTLYIAERTDYGYYISTSEDPTGTYYVSGLSRTDTIFFPHNSSTGADGTSISGYWLTSTSANTNFQLMYAGIR